MDIAGRRMVPLQAHASYQGKRPSRRRFDDFGIGCVMACEACDDQG